MKTRKTAWRAMLVAASLSVFAAGSASGADDALGNAKSLYLAASYQEALAALANLPAGSNIDEADKYRALCYLGLNRSEDAKQALERLVTRRPLYKLDPFDSPKLVAMFQDARQHALPEAAKTLYAAAKKSFEKGDLATASSQFTDLQTLLAQPEVAADSSLADLKLLADGFAKLANRELAADKPAPAAVAPAAPVPSQASEDLQRIFSSGDSDVVAPAVITQTLPRWQPTPNLQEATFTGVLEIVIDERGEVASARMAQPVNALYDRRLLSAAKGWRYRPATRAGHPVKYRKTINVALRPVGSGSSQEPVTNE
jgi:TonB family protein